MFMDFIKEFHRDKKEESNYPDVFNYPFNCQYTLGIKVYNRKLAKVFNFIHETSNWRNYDDIILVHYDDDTYEPSIFEIKTKLFDVVDREQMIKMFDYIKLYEKMAGTSEDQTKLYTSYWYNIQELILNKCKIIVQRDISVLNSMML